jgi:putative phosphoribosyl transferase
MPAHGRQRSHRPQRRFTELVLAMPFRPHPLTGIVTVPDDARGLVMVCSSAPAAQTAALVARLEQEPEGPGLAVALFEDLLPGPCRADPLTPFDTNVMAARLVTAMEVVTGHRTLSNLPLGCLGIGGGTAAAVIAATERPADVAALVLLQGSLVPASASLPALLAPTLYLRPGSDEEDCGFLATGAGRKREIRGLPGGLAARSPAGVTLASRHARRWFERHLVTTSQ